MNKPFFNNRRTHERPTFGAPEYSQDFAEVDTGAEIVFTEEPADRYKSVPASAYNLEQQLSQGIKPEKTGVYMHMEKMHGSEVAMRTIEKLQQDIDAARVNRELRKLQDNQQSALLASARNIAGLNTPPSE